MPGVTACASPLFKITDESTVFSELLGFDTYTDQGPCAPGQCVCVCVCVCVCLRVCGFALKEENASVNQFMNAYCTKHVFLMTLFRRKRTRGDINQQMPRVQD